MEKKYEVYAVAYGRVDRMAAANFIGGVQSDYHMPLFYYFWVIRDEERVIIVDTGFDKASAWQRDRTLLRPVEEGLGALSIDPDDVRDVIITHLHYDHAGNKSLFPNARYHLQDAEMAFATGRSMCHARVRSPYNVEDVVAMVRWVYAERVRFHDGFGVLAPGISLHRIGGHSRGLQVVLVNTECGKLVLASDSVPFYRHFQSQSVYPVVDCLPDILDGYQKISELASSAENIIPGHDPEVMNLYPAMSSETVGWIARLDRGRVKVAA